MEITNEMWDKAVLHAQTMSEIASQLPSGTGFFYVIGCQTLIGRYNCGERTEELYNEMIRLS